MSGVGPAPHPRPTPTTVDPLTRRGPEVNRPDAGGGSAVVNAKLAAGFSNPPRGRHLWVEAVVEVVQVYSIGP